jgi:hypothetical protein
VADSCEHGRCGAQFPAREEFGSVELTQVLRCDDRELPENE